MLDNEIVGFLKKKDFRNAWQMLEYLLDAGYDEDEATDLISEFFTETDYFRDVAYGRIIGIVKKESPDSVIDDVEMVLFIGLIDNTNQGLRGMFDRYKKAIFEGKVDNSVQRDMEDLCNEKYVFRNLDDATLDYLRNIAIKHYGYALL